MFTSAYVQFLALLVFLQIVLSVMHLSLRPPASWRPVFCDPLSQCWSLPLLTPCSPLYSCSCLSFLISCWFISLFSAISLDELVSQWSFPCFHSIKVQVDCFSLSLSVTVGWKLVFCHTAYRYKLCTDKTIRRLTDESTDSELICSLLLLGWGFAAFLKVFLGLFMPLW